MALRITNYFVFDHVDSSDKHLEMTSRLEKLEDNILSIIHDR